MMRLLVARLLTVVALSSSVAAAAHAVVITPTAANLIAGSQAFPTLSQSNINYVIDGTIDYDQWFGVSPFPGTIRFNLGGTFDLAGMDIWNNAGYIENDGEGINSFTLTFRDASLSTLGSFAGTLTDTLAQQTKTFSASNVDFVDLEIVSNHSTIRDYALFYEINFTGTPSLTIPEPTTLALLGLGLAGLGYSRRRTP